MLLCETLTRLWRRGILPPACDAPIACSQHDERVFLV
jgi:hypothetical protein